MKMQWTWSHNKNHQLLGKLVVSFLFAGVAFRLLFPGSAGFSDVSETGLLLAVDLPDNRAHPPETENPFEPQLEEPKNGTLKPNPEFSDDLQATKDQVVVNGTQFWGEQENGTLKSIPDFADDLQGNEDQGLGNSTQLPVDSNSTATGDFQDDKKGKCDLFMGDWRPYPAGPRYTNDTCNFIEGHQNCMRNGRPDTGYLYWRWNPRDCELPLLDEEMFLELMRNKTWALIGDSITRNHIQSLLCLLSKVEQAVEVYHDKKWQTRRWSFPSYNFTISTLWSPFLAKAEIFEDFNGVSTADVELHLDQLDPTWTDLYHGLDYMMFSSGKWYVKTAIYHENNTVLGCHYCAEGKNHTQMGFDVAYRKVLKRFFNFILESNYNGTIFFRTSTPEHFEHGEWYEGGNCKRTEPIKEEEFKMSEVTRVLRAVELEEFGKVAANASEKGIDLRLFDVMQLSSMRADGHPDIYRFFHPSESGNGTTKVISDCLHWCLPGPIDAWNDLLMAMVVNG